MPATATAVPATGGQLVNSNQTLFVEVPPAAVAEPVTLAYRPITLPTPAAGDAAIPLAGFSLTAQTAGGEAITRFRQPLTITVRYDATGLSRDQQLRLVIFFFRESTQTWVGLPTTVDLERAIATATVDHFTTFALFAPVAPTPTATASATATPTGTPVAGAVATMTPTPPGATPTASPAASTTPVGESAVTPTATPTVVNSPTSTVSPTVPTATTSRTASPAAPPHRVIIFRVMKDGPAW